MYSQNQEEQIILNYFDNVKVGHVLDIGANDGKTFSNSLALIERGWMATLIEPHPVAFDLLRKRHAGNSFVECYKIAIADKTGTMKLSMNSPHIAGDTGLLSTLVESETDKWKGVVSYDTISVPTYTFKDFQNGFKCDKFDFITIDAEGMDYAILSQIDLTAVGCKMVCVEHNSVELQKYIDYCERFGMSVKHVNPENLIMAL
jgi:FkbM family methyltransferase